MHQLAAVRSQLNHSGRASRSRCGSFCACESLPPRMPWKILSARMTAFSACGDVDHGFSSLALFFDQFPDSTSSAVFCCHHPMAVYAQAQAIRGHRMQGLKGI